MRGQQRPPVLPQGPPSPLPRTTPPSSLSRSDRKAATLPCFPVPRARRKFPPSVFWSESYITPLPETRSEACGLRGPGLSQVAGPPATAAPVQGGLGVPTRARERGTAFGARDVAGAPRRPAVRADAAAPGEGRHTRVRAHRLPRGGGWDGSIGDRRLGTVSGAFARRPCKCCGRAVSPARLPGPHLVSLRHAEPAPRRPGSRPTQSCRPPRRRVWLQPGQVPRRTGNGENGVQGEEGPGPGA